MEPGSPCRMSGLHACSLHGRHGGVRQAAGPCHAHARRAASAPHICGTLSRPTMACACATRRAPHTS
eukprot:11275359-Alexandrium_andersonii.AAC.1